MARSLLWASNWYENILETGLWIRGERQFGMLTQKKKRQTSAMNQKTKIRENMIEYICMIAFFKLIDFIF